ncbi:MAG: ribonuclease III [Verrucomicrobiaceae bacterium]|nr:ribonuclease III [Verrucomicrobiaceae bacterium]
MEPLESILGHTFLQPRLLTEALTHGSVSYEAQRAGIDNQRLEFLGDAVLQLSLSHALFNRLGNADEGRLTKSRAHLVSTKSLARLARDIGLGPYLHMGRGEEASGGRDRDSTLADALEAVVGALYLDGGIDAASGFILRVFCAELDLLGDGLVESNPKGDLQERLQAVHSEAPAYRIIAQTGPDHAKSFEAAVTWRGHELGRGAGKSKKEAEVQAASSALANPELDTIMQTTT